MVSRPGTKAPPPPPDHTSSEALRVEVTATSIHVFGYPSNQKHPVIALEDVSAVDLEHLQLDRLALPRTRLQDPAAEDAFCRRLLQIGGRRWPTLDRFRLVLDAIACDDVVIEWLQDGTQPIPSFAERLWISVARPSQGGICVAELPRWVPEVVDSEEVSVEQHEMLGRRALLRLAANMDEKASLLMGQFGGQYYAREVEYHGEVLDTNDLGCLWCANHCYFGASSVHVWLYPSTVANSKQ